MTDAHFHRNGFETYFILDDREFRFVGIHPWQADSMAYGSWFMVHDSLLRLAGTTAPCHEPGTKNQEPISGIGEIGLDRLKNKNISDAQRKLFTGQLEIAAELHRPVVLHGAKCWGEVVKECAKVKGEVPAFLFHGFSRSTGLVPEMIAMNGFVSLGPALLNDHAVNYHAMAKELPADRIMIETDTDWSAQAQSNATPAGSRVGAFNAPVCPQAELLGQLLGKLAQLRGCAVDALAAAINENASQFLKAIS